MNTGNKIEVADIFRQYGKEYLTGEKQQPVYIIKAISAIERCRTSALGGHKEKCDKCGHQRISYNSCRNRHCPKCQSLARERWIAERERELLPVKYFHIVFTIPQELNAIVLENKRVLYETLFRAGSETLLKLGKDEKHLGGDIGIIAVLHTWGQNLMDHPHLHCIVPGGGLSIDKKRWLRPKKGKRKDFFIHVNVISDLFKKKFLYYLKRLYERSELQFTGKIKSTEEIKEFTGLIARLYEKKWVTYCKKPFGGAEQVIKYLGRYTHRVAISNNRIKSIDGGEVKFSYKDYRDGANTKQMTLKANEFIRRFLLHILPEGFYKIRYYGILSSRNKKSKLERCKELLGKNETCTKDENKTKSWKELLYELTGIDLEKCPKCKEGRMKIVETILPVRISSGTVKLPP